MCKSPGGCCSLNRAHGSCHSFLAGSPKDVLPISSPKPSPLDAFARTYQKLAQSSSQQNLISFTSEKTFLDNLANRPPINYNSPLRCSTSMFHSRSGSGYSNGHYCPLDINPLPANHNLLLSPDLDDHEVCDNCRICVRHRKVSIQSSGATSSASDECNTIVPSTNGTSSSTAANGLDETPPSKPAVSLCPLSYGCQLSPPQKDYSQEVPTADEIESLRKSKPPGLVEEELTLWRDNLDFGLVIRGNGPSFFQTVDPAGPGRRAGLKKYQIILSVNRQDVLRTGYKEVSAKMNPYRAVQLTLLTLPTSVLKNGKKN